MTKETPRSHAHLSVANLFNASLCLGALVLWTASVDAFGDLCSTTASPVCLHPVLGVSSLLLATVSLPFWVVGLIQRSVWLIDPFWSLIPLTITYAYYSNPARPDDTSGHFEVVLGLLIVWSLRSLHTYFRREGFKFGVREDWRYTLVAETYSRHWWWMSFWAVGFLQQIMLTGLTLPVYSVLFHPKPDWTFVDGLATAICLVGISLAFSADNDLHRFMTSDRRSRDILRSGLWKWSRHPNYFGEQLFWWSLSLFSVSRGDAWAIVGTLFNTIILIPTANMTEERMLTHWSPQRSALYRKYQKTTSRWIPWWTSWEKV